MKKLLISLLAVAMISVSCSDNDDADNCIEFKNEAAESAELFPTADMMGYAYRVMFHCSNGCGNFDSFQETVNGNTRTIKVLAKYEGCICTQDIPERNGVYIFNPTVAGTYTLKFDKGDGTYITETVVKE